MAKSKNQGCIAWPFYLGCFALAFISFTQRSYSFAVFWTLLAAVLIFIDWRMKVAEEKQRIYEKKREDWNRAHARPFDDEYKIKGINFRRLNKRFLGDFEGTAKACRFNEHDPYAVAILIGDYRVGYFPAGQQFLHEQIIAKGGEVKCYGYIGRKEDEDDGRFFYFGRVWFEDVEK